jgi:hypothetical protein
VQVLCKELGISENRTVNGNSTYSPATIPEREIHEIIQGVATTFDVKFPQEPKLAHIYPIPKLHKNPYKFRFIASARNSSLKPLSQKLDRILKQLQTHFHRYCNHVKERTGINLLWSINSSQQFLRKLRSFTKSNISRRELFSGDFSEMFTAIKIETLQENLQFLVDLCFNNAGKPFLNTSANYPQYLETQETKHCLSRHDISYLIDFILRNNYVSFAGHRFKQTKGVPMGLPSAPKMIDLAMSVCEFRFLSNTANRTVASSISRFCCRYVDDFFSLVDQPILPILHQIYPAELTLNVTSEPYHTTFLDVDIQLVSGALQTQMYNKTDDFPFKVIRYGHISSNVHPNSCYNTFFGEVLRCVRISNTREKCENRLKSIILDFLSLGYDATILVSKINKCFINHKSDFVSCGFVTDKDLIEATQRIIP